MAVMVVVATMAGYCACRATFITLLIEIGDELSWVGKVLLCFQLTERAKLGFEIGAAKSPDTHVSNRCDGCAARCMLK